MTVLRLFSGKNCRGKAITAAWFIATIALLFFAASDDVTAQGISAGPSPTDDVVVDGIPSDISINGPGYFLVRDIITGLAGVTRYGNFEVDFNGYLITPTGKRVQGFNDWSLTNFGDIQINSDSPVNPMVIYHIQADGRIVVTLQDNTTYVRCQILLQQFKNPAALVPQGWRVYGATSNAGPLPQPFAPGTANTNFIASGQLEHQQVPRLQLDRYSPNAFNQGVLFTTGVPSDIGIEGKGFFILRRTNDNALFATRAGAFYPDESGYLVHYSGYRLQGYTGSDKSTLGDIQITPPGVAIPGYAHGVAYAYSIDTLGNIIETMSDVSAFFTGRVLLADCTNLNRFTRTNFGLYPVGTNAASWSPLAPPISGNLGWLVSGTLEPNQLDTNLLAFRTNLNFFSQGPISTTDIPSNLALDGLGFFTVRDPVSNTFYATRFGEFQADAVGHLVTPDGYYLQGLSDSGLNRTGDIVIDSVGAPSNASVNNFSIDDTGAIHVLLADGGTFVRGQVLIQVYRNPQALAPFGGNYYSNVTAALPIYTNGLTGYVPLALIESSTLESNPGSPPAPQLPPAVNCWRVFVSYLDYGTLQSSSDLIHWTALSDISGSMDLNTAEYFDTEATDQRYYRVLVKNY